MDGLLESAEPSDCPSIQSGLPVPLELPGDQPNQLQTANGEPVLLDPSSGPPINLEPSSSVPINLEPFSGSGYSQSSAVMNGSKAKKRKSEEKEITSVARSKQSSERSKEWRQKQMELNPEAFKEKERIRSRNRRAKKTESKETQTDLTISGHEVLRKMVPLPEHPARYTFADQWEGNAIPYIPENVLEQDCDPPTMNGKLDARNLGESFSKMALFNGDISQRIERDRPTFFTDDIREVYRNPMSGTQISETLDLALMSPFTVSSSNFDNTDQEVLKAILDDSDEGGSLSNDLDTPHEDFQNSNDVDTGERTTPTPEGIVQERIITYENTNLEEPYTPHMQRYVHTESSYNEGNPRITDIQAYQDKIYIWSEGHSHVVESREITENSDDDKKIHLQGSYNNPVTSISISPGTGAIWYTRKDNCVFKHFNGNSTQMFRTNFPPKLFLIESSNGSDILYLFHNNGLEVRDENGRVSGQCTRFVSPDNGRFQPATMKRDSVSGRLLITDNITDSCQAVLIDTPFQRTDINLEKNGNFRTIQCGYFDENGDIILELFQEYT